ncbi:MAG: hypothetical protein JNK78_03330 [Planctomycetes bacterium]|nr:hypothetical protein [Planctomycetota bacterium]
MKTRIASLFSMLAITTAAAPCFAQCELQWQPGDPVPFARGAVDASTVWDPDGTGPAAPVLVVGGRFAAGTMLATGVAAFDGASWLPLGTPPMANVNALTVWNGLLVAAGGSGSQQPIATWDGATWTVLGNTNGVVRTMTTFNGDLFVGGLFRVLNGAQMRSVAHWNGSSWSEPGGGIGGEVRAMAVLGSLFVGGSLTSAGGVPVGNLALWNGASWSAGATFDGPIDALAVRSNISVVNSFVFAGGSFTTVGTLPAAHIARFTLSTGAWSAVPSLPGASCRALHVRSTGTFTFQLHAGVVDPGAPDKVWRLNGSSWVSLGAVTDAVEPNPTTLAFWNGQYAVGLDHSPAVQTPLERAVRLHDGTSWQGARGPGLDGPVYCATAAGADVVVGGAFVTAGGAPLNRIAIGRPGAWAPLGSGFANGSVEAVCRWPNGDIVAGGTFTLAGSTPVNHVARWDGSSWQPLGAGTDETVFALAALPNGDVVAGGSFFTAGGVTTNFVARWNGTSWSALGVGMENLVTALAVKSDGTIVAAGAFTVADGASANCIATWNGVAWSPLGTGLDDAATAVAVLPNGDIVAGGHFDHAGGVLSPHVARWNGSTWLAESSTTFAWDAAVLSLLPLPNGDYFAGGPPSFFGPGGPFPGAEAVLARHTGGAGSLAWSALDIDGDFLAAAAATASGDVFVGGRFDAAGGAASNNVAALAPTCPAAGTSYGAGCVGSGGQNVLAVQSLPWIGGVFEARATGMPATAFAFVITGLSTASVPISLILAEGQPGCDLLVALDILGGAVPIGGVAVTQFPFADTMSLAGVVFHQQVVPFEIGPAGDVAAVTSTNALTLTIGAM